MIISNIMMKSFHALMSWKENYRWNTGIHLMNSRLKETGIQTQQEHLHASGSLSSDILIGILQSRIGTTNQNLAINACRGEY